eukprot:3004414-Alexandrium_andersonii.AAC.1
MYAPRFLPTPASMCYASAPLWAPPEVRPGSAPVSPGDVSSATSLGLLPLVEPLALSLIHI